MSFTKNISGFVRIPTAINPNRVYSIGPEGEKINDPDHLLSVAGTPTVDEAFKMVKDITPEEAAKLGVTDAEAQLANNDANSGLNLNGEADNALAQGLGGTDLALDDYLKLLSSQSEITPDETANIRKNLGIDTLETSVFAKPSKTSEQLYQNAYSTAGLAEIKAKMSELNKVINEKKSALIKRVGEINDNPWMTESSRLRSVRDMISLAQDDMGNVVNEMNQYKELYNTGLGEVNNFITRNQTDFSVEQGMNKDKLSYLLKKAEDTATALKSSKMEKLYRYVPEFLKSKAGAKKPETLNTDQGQFAWNSKTGKFEIIPGTETAPKKDTSIVEVNNRKVLVDNQTGAILKDLGAASSGAASKATESEVKTYYKQSMAGELSTVVGKDGFISPENWRIARKNWTDNTPYSGKEFDDNFRDYVNPGDPQDYAGFEDYAPGFKKAPNISY